MEWKAEQYDFQLDNQKGKKLKWKLEWKRKGKSFQKLGGLENNWNDKWNGMKSND